MPPQGVISLLVKGQLEFHRLFFSTATQLEYQVLKYFFFSIAEFGFILSPAPTPAPTLNRFK